MDATEPKTAGTVAENPIVEVLCDLARRGATGRLQVTDGKRSRELWLEDGELACTRSNLKGESIERLRESFPEASPAQILELQAALRVMNAVGVGSGEWRFHENDAAPVHRPGKLLDACWQGLVRRVPDAFFQEWLGRHRDRHPRLAQVSPAILPFDATLRAFVYDLDGGRTLEEAVDFAPLDAALAVRAIYLGTALGAIRIEDSGQGIEVHVTSAEPAAPPEPRPPEEPAGQAPEEPARQAEGIADLIALQLGEKVVHPDEAPAESDPELESLRRELDRVEAASDHFEVLGLAWDAPETAFRKAYFDLARSYHPDSWSGRPEERRQIVERIFARVSAAWEVLGDASSRQAYIDRVIHGKKSEDELATERVQEILAAEDDFRAGLGHFNAGHLVQAHEVFKSCVERVPEEAEFRAYLGYTTFKLNARGDPEQAERGEEMLKEALDQTSRLDRGWVLMGRVYRDRGETDLARKCFIRALKIQPSNPDAPRELKRIEREREKAERESTGFLGRLLGRRKKGGNRKNE